MVHHRRPFSAEQLRGSLAALSAADGYYAGFSGGADSTALLLALCELGVELGAPFRAVHVNHGLHADAAEWQRHCERFCAERGIELICLQVRPDPDSGRGVEAEARHLRYQAMAALLGAGDSLLTAHHADDQAETVLLNLMRGSGVDGLSAMPPERPLGAGLLQRPLLDFDNQALEDYLRGRNVGWLEDPSNQFLAHDRNYLRHQIMPALDRRWPGVVKRLSLTRRAMAETRRVLETLADDLLGRSLPHPRVLSLAGLADADPGLVKLVVRRWLKRNGTPSLPVHRLETLLRQIGEAGAGSNVCIRWDHCALHLYRGQLWLQTDGPAEPCARRAWPSGGRVDLGPHTGPLELEGEGAGLPGVDLLSFGRRQCTEPSLLRNGHHQGLKNIFQAAGVPPWLRDAVPLTAQGGGLAAVGDWCIADPFSEWLRENRLRLVWHPRDPLLRYIRDLQHAGETIRTNGDELH